MQWLSLSRTKFTSSFDNVRYGWALPQASTSCATIERLDNVSTTSATNEQAVLRFQEKVFLWSNELDPIYDMSNVIFCQKRLPVASSVVCTQHTDIG